MAVSNSYSSFFEILAIVKKSFDIKDAYVEEDIPTFIISSPSHLKAKIEILRSELKPRGFEIVIHKSDIGLKLRVLTLKQKPSSRFFGLRYPLILLIATIVSVAISGYIMVSSHLDVLRILGRIRLEDEFSYLLGQTALYTLSVMCIVGLHELGHILAFRKNRLEASFPLFIPGIPGITLGTFGAIMLLKEPVLNRDQLFDMGFSGPFVGFIISLIVLSFGVTFSLPIMSIEEYNLITSIAGPAQPVYLPLVITLLEPYLFSNAGSITHILHPLAIAGWMGMLLTFLNAFPMGQFDGGHVARAIFDSKRHRTLSYVAAIFMFLSGWWSMALVAFLFIGFQHPGVLDDVSPLSRNKKILALFFVMLLFLCFTISPDSLLALFLSE